MHFNFVHYIVQVTTWWWSESSHGLIDTEEICISFNEIVLTLGYWLLSLYVVCTTLGFDPGFVSPSSSCIKFMNGFSIVNHILSALSPAVYPLKVGIIDLGLI